MNTSAGVSNGTSDRNGAGISPHVKYLLDRSDADIIIRSSDNVTFRTFQSILILGSPVLKDLIQQQLDLTLQEDAETTLPTLHMPEDSHTIERLLLLSYPRWTPFPELNHLQEVKNILAAAVKYKMEGALKFLREALKNSPLIAKEPRRFFAIACQYKLAEAAKLAVRHTFPLPLCSDEITPELDDISAGALYRLHACHYECRAAVCELVASFKSLYYEGKGFTCFESPLSTRGESPTCTEQWWIDCIKELTETLTKSPRIETSLSREFIKNASSKAADRCPICKNRSVSDMNKTFAVEVEKLMIKISGRFSIYPPRNRHLHLSAMTSTNTTMMTSPFNDHRADVILRTSDLVDFRVHTLVLSLVSPVFDSMFNLPQPPDAEDALPVISVSESSRTLEKFLGFCYPGRDPELADLNDVGDILEVMSKYDVETVKNRVRRSLLAPIFLETEPLRVFAIAQLYHLEYETRRAALYTLRRPQFEVYCTELERISARPYHRLAEYGAKCRTAAARVATVPNFDWITGRFGWFSCRENSSPDTEFRISNSTRKMDRKHWWLTYMRAVSVALADIPWFNTPKISQEIDIAMNKALACDTCRKSIISEMRTLNRLLAAEVERVVTDVRLEVRF